MDGTVHPDAVHREVGSAGHAQLHPPEILLESNKAPGPKHDVYGFAIIIWELLTQKKPYSGFNMVMIIIRVTAGMRPSLQPVSDQWPSEAQQMVDLMKRCWDQDPKKRPCFF